MAQGGGGCRQHGTQHQDITESGADQSIRVACSKLGLHPGPTSYLLPSWSPCQEWRGDQDYDADVYNAPPPLSGPNPAAQLDLLLDLWPIPRNVCIESRSGFNCNQNVRQTSTSAQTVAELETGVHADLGLLDRADFLDAQLRRTRICLHLGSVHRVLTVKSAILEAGLAQYYPSYKLFADYRSAPGLRLPPPLPPRRPSHRQQAHERAGRGVSQEAAGYLEECGRGCDGGGQRPPDPLHSQTPPNPVTARKQPRPV